MVLKRCTCVITLVCVCMCVCSNQFIETEVVGQKCYIVFIKAPNGEMNNRFYSEQYLISAA